MRVAIHQPEYWPIPRLLAKWDQADLLILLDTVQFTRDSLQHRCKVQSLDGVGRYLTIAFRHMGEPFPQIRSLEAAAWDWPRGHLNRLQNWYRGGGFRAGHAAVARWYEEAAACDPESIALHTGRSMLTAAEWAGITTPVRWASTLMPPPGGWERDARGTRRNANDLLIHLCRVVGAKTFIAGETSFRSYLDVSEFLMAGITVEPQVFHAVDGDELSSLHVFLTAGPEVLAQQIRP